MKDQKIIIDEFTLLPQSYQDVILNIPIGIDNAIPTRIIAENTGQKPRAIRSKIHHLIKKYEVPICANRLGEVKGMYIPRNHSELQQGIAQLQSQVDREIERLEQVKNSDIDSAIIRKWVIDPNGWN